MATYPTIYAGQDITAGVLRSMLPDIKIKTVNTERVSNTNLTLDPDLQATLDPGVYLVEFNMLPAATLDADFRTEWRVPLDSGGFKSVLGPSSTASDGLADNISMRAGVHDYDTDVVYSGVRNNANAFMVQEFSVITLTYAGVVGIAWAQAASSTSPAIMWNGSWMRVTRLG